MGVPQGIDGWVSVFLKKWVRKVWRGGASGASAWTPEKGWRRGGRSEGKNLLGQIGSPCEGIESGQEGRDAFLWGGGMRLSRCGSGEKRVFFCGQSTKN